MNSKRTALYDYDPNDFLVNGMLELLDQYQRLEIALKLSRGRRKKAEQGGYAGGGTSSGSGGSGSGGVTYDPPTPTQIMAVRTGLFDGTVGIPPSGGSFLGVVNALFGVSDIQNDWRKLTLPGVSIWQRLGGAGEIFANLAIDASMVDGGGEAVRVAEIGAEAAKEVEATVNVVDKGTADTRKFWNSTTEFKGVKVYQRNDLIDPNATDKLGRTNLQRMNDGLAPLGPDGKPINLHHMTQTNDSAIAEVTQSFHQENTSIIHINPNTIPSGIDRNAFGAWRQGYWKNRANGFH